MNTKELIRKEIERQSTGTQRYSDTEERLMRFKPGVDQKLSLARARMRAHVRTLFLDLCFSVFVFVLLVFFGSLSPSYFKEIHGALGTDLSFYLSSLSIRVIGSMGVVYLHLQVALPENHGLTKCRSVRKTDFLFKQSKETILILVFRQAS